MVCYIFDSSLTPNKSDLGLMIEGDVVRVPSVLERTLIPVRTRKLTVLDILYRVAALASKLALSLGWTNQEVLSACAGAREQLRLAFPNDPEFQVTRMTVRFGASECRVKD